MPGIIKIIMDISGYIINLLQLLFDYFSRRDDKRIAKSSLKQVEYKKTDQVNENYLEYKVRYIGGPPRSAYWSDSGTTYLRPDATLKLGCTKKSGMDFSKIFVISKVKKHYNIGHEHNLQQLYFSPRNSSFRNKHDGIPRGNDIIQGELKRASHDSDKQALYIDVFPTELFLKPSKFGIIHILISSSNSKVQLVTLVIKIGRMVNGKLVAGHKNGGSEIKDECLIFDNVEELQDKNLWLHQLREYQYSLDQKKDIIETYRAEALDSCKNIERYLSEKGTTLQHF